MANACGNFFSPVVYFFLDEELTPEKQAYKLNCSKKFRPLPPCLNLLNTQRRIQLNEDLYSQVHYIVFGWLGCKISGCGFVELYGVFLEFYKICGYI